MKKAIIAVVALASLAAAGYSYARPSYGRSYEYYDAQGVQIGGAEFSCNAQWFYWGDTSGTKVLVETYPCY
ncbi:hypothetical protein [Pseudoduganella violaceinigra]|uniref:hypothetical protein n=1 Tax=Pseudoduganella violaceinigra TaxID=246602 RepID=UPI0004105E21|nr:hypothetical protein [Pseudoduganella violaceinigra]